MIRYLYFCLLSFFFLSCISKRYIDIQVLKPAKIALSYKIDTLFFLNSLKISASQPDTGKLSLYKTFINQFNVTLSKNLRESPLFSNTNIKIVNFPYIYKSYQSADYEPRSRIFICRFDSITTKDTTYKTYDYFLDDEIIYSKLAYRTIYKVYLQFSNYLQSNQQFTIEDTLIWETPAINSTEKVTINKVSAFQEIGRLSAIKFSRDIAPFWYTDERLIYYASNRLMRKGYQEFVNNDMFSSINYWKKLYESGTRNLAYKAAYNIALSYETMDSLYLSKDWLEKSIKVRKMLYNSDYLIRIQKRIREKEELDSQFQLLNK